ncbi:MAG: ribonuclease Z [Saprospirales bacterium]|nr:MAG: ribonuclease Z [Saprospirales bacterium]
MEYRVLILGSNSALPAYGRHPSAQYLRFGGHNFLLDCGEGTQIQMQRFRAKGRKLSHVFITHLHGDHFFGIFGLLQSFNLLNRTEALSIFGPPGIKDLIYRILQLSGNPLQYPCEINEIEAKERTLLYDAENTSVYAFPLKHRVPCNGFIFAEKRPSVSLCKDKLEEYGVHPHLRESLRRGEDYRNEEGEVIPAELFYKKMADPRVYAYCSDTMPFPELITYLEGVTTLYHEATFLNTEKARAEETGHSTAKQAAEAALNSSAKKLIIGHFSSRYRDFGPLVKEAKETFSSTYAAVEGRWMDLV